MPQQVTADTITSSYWLNWRFFLCAIWILLCMVIATFIIWKYENLDDLKSDGEGNQQDPAQFLCNDDAWRPCIKEIHPLWLLLFRAIAFCFLLTTLILKSIHSGGYIFFFYTQWTFILVTFYFWFGSLLSIYGCYLYHKISIGSLDVHHAEPETEQGNFVSLANGECTNISEMRGVLNKKEEIAPKIISYLFQVIYQMNAGAVMLTDCIYWFIIFPFLTVNDYKMNFMTVNMHTLNLVLLLGDTVLNCLQFPWFRASYFVLWTSVFVIFQWIVHGCVSIRWPYPFLDLSLPLAPLWYILVGLMHIPCYALFALIVRTKHYLFSKWFPRSYRCLR